MRDINKAIVVGRLTRDPELRHSQSGIAVLNLGVAVNDSRKNRDGQWEEYANFIDCVMTGDRAEKLAGMLAKGTKVAIDGKLHYSTWEKDGQKRSKLEVVIDQLEFMSRKEESKPEPELYDDDIPF